MAGKPPVVYLVHGEDEFSIAQFVAEIRAKLGDAAMAAMDYIELDGRFISMDELVTATQSIPFLAKRRLVVLNHPLSFAGKLSSNQIFLDFLENIPVSSALVLLENRRLTDEEDRRKGKIHWLESWVVDAGDRAFLRYCGLRKGKEMSGWIQDRARELGGQFSYQGADLLSSLVGEDSRLADQEIQKLLSYVDFQRPVTADDIELFTPFAGESNIFDMVDALGNQDGRQALRLLHRLLEEQDPLSIFGMVVRQFRLLLLTREILDQGGGEGDIVNSLSIPQFVARKMSIQARHFDMATLELVYEKLSEVDESIKTGQMDARLSLDLVVASLTA
jgi:DNA polymerase-3 subunit delta